MTMTTTTTTVMTTVLACDDDVSSGQRSLTSYAPGTTIIGMRRRKRLLLWTSRRTTRSQMDTSLFTFLLLLFLSLSKPFDVEHLDFVVVAGFVVIPSIPAGYNINRLADSVNHGQQKSGQWVGSLSSSSSSSSLFYRGQNLDEMTTNNKNDTTSTANDSKNQTAAVTIILPKSYTSSPATDPSQPVAITASPMSPRSSSTFKPTTQFILQPIQRMLHKFRELKPGTKFRWKLGFLTTAIVALSTAAGGGLIKAFGANYFTSLVRFMNLTRTWLSHRGWQGLAAMGRSVAYGWAVFVAYPRVLDKRQQDRRAKKRADYLAVRRRRLTRLSDQVSKLRAELRQIDAEIRSFKREIIAMKAYRNSGIGRRHGYDYEQHRGQSVDNRDDDSSSSERNSSNSNIDRDIQDAIDAEMMDLRQLRHNTYDAFVAARAAYADYLAETSAELSDDDEDGDFGHDEVVDFLHI